MMAIMVTKILSTLGSIGTMILNRPYPPIFSSSAASTTEPAVGASTWASGSQVWKGNAGILTRNPSSSPAKMMFSRAGGNISGFWVAFSNVSISKVLDPSGSW